MASLLRKPLPARIVEMADSSETGSQVDQPRANGDASDPAAKKAKHFPRLVPRNMPFSQSKNKVAVIHNKGVGIAPLLRHDWFHVFLRLPSKYSLSMMLSLWTGVILIFAAMYVAYDTSNTKEVCRLGAPPNDPITFGAAFAFSVETCTTVGYGLPSGTNAFFEGCPGLQALICLQMIWSMMFNAFLFAFLYNRLGRSESRGAQVVNSNKAIVCIEDGQVRLQCRIYDIDARHPVVEAHVRIYVVMRERPVPRPLRLIQPNDELGATLFLSFPTVVSHHIDVYSMLHPPLPENDPDGVPPVAPSGLILREADSTTACREEVICPVCGESYGTHERWINHVRYNSMVEAKEQYPVEGSHQSIVPRQLRKPRTPTLQEFQEHFEANVAELIVIVEGIDPLLSGTFSALHSYRYEDIVWEETARFEPCVQVSGNVVQVDIDRFHHVDITQTVPQDAAKAIRRRRRIKQFSNRVHDSFFEAESSTGSAVDSK